MKKVRFLLIVLAVFSYCGCSTSAPAPVRQAPSSVQHQKPINAPQKTEGAVKDLDDLWKRMSALSEPEKTRPVVSSERRLESYPEGTIFFQSLGVKVVQAGQNGYELDHCGILLMAQDGSLQVFHAYPPACHFEHPNAFLKERYSRLYAKILPNITEGMLMRARAKAYSMIGIAYDRTFGVNPQPKHATYCSLAVRDVIAAMGVHLDDVETPANDLNLAAPVVQKYLKKKGITPAQIEKASVVTVKSLYRSRHFKTVGERVYKQ